jgi:cell division protein FtsI (penicillin-binding protein 3)
VSDSTDVRIYRRAFAVTLAVVSLIALGTGRLAYVQFRGSEGVSSPDPDEVILPALRGNIYDRNGYLLAVSSVVYDVGVAPRQVSDKEVLADRLAPLLAKPRSEVLELLQSGDQYVRLQRSVSAELLAKITSLDVRGLQVEERPSRVYPNGSLAACVLGFVTDDGEAVYGLESFYDGLLRGQDGVRKSARDVLGSLSYQVVSPRDGAVLHLSLDRNIQSYAEEALARAVDRTQAEKGVVVVMEPGTGAVLALAAMPSFDPNYRHDDDPGVWTNTAVSEPYEPGSVFKMITMASALDAKAIGDQDTYWDSGAIVVGGETIENSDRQAHGQTTMYDLLAHSLNVGAASVSTKLGAIRFYEYVRGFGFADITGIDLAYELPGSVRFPGDREWHESDLATNSFGQGLAVTPVQMLSAVCAIANGGRLMRPYVVARIETGDTVTNTVPEETRRVVSSQAAAQVTDMLVYTVDETLSAASVPGYRVAGKSGTSQVPVPGGYDPDETIASFAGFVPADNPRLAILVALYRPQEEHWGERAAAPVFREIAEPVLGLMAVPPDRARTSFLGP